MNHPDPFDPIRFEAALEAQGQGEEFGRNRYLFPALPSTNTFLRDLAAADPTVPHATLALADFQSAGRGRLDRTWLAPPATCLLFSLLLRPVWPSARLPWLAMIAGLAVIEAIEAVTPLRPALKWPNDIVMVRENGRLFKLGGILLELLQSGNERPVAIVGTGLNVNIAPGELPAGRLRPTSLLIECGEAVAREPLLAAILARHEAWYRAAAGGHSPRAAWRDRLTGLGQPVRVTTPLGYRYGVAEDVDSRGNLLLRSADNRLETISAGDIDFPGTSS
jgi:BirA family biotin operon repressor/biotin-[acetyl-CoA-carboxylase] ligase